MGVQDFGLVLDFAISGLSLRAGGAGAGAEALDGGVEIALLAGGVKLKPVKPVLGFACCGECK